MMMNPVSDLPQTRARPEQLAAALRDSFAKTVRCVGDLSAAQWVGAYSPIINPPLWETGHVAWFLERWMLRRARGADSLITDADTLYDSSRIAHETRWSLPLPDSQATLAYLGRVTNAVLQLLDSGRISDTGELYYLELCVYHQDMHNEALRYTRQTLNLSNPFASLRDFEQRHYDAPRLDGDAQIEAGVVALGSTRGDGWIFDNEKWAHEVSVPAFAMAKRQVSNGEFLAFVADAGYHRREFWCEAGWRWCAENDRRHPIYWRLREYWEQRMYEHWLPLVKDWPVLHVSAFEADAYCRWAGRRLPSEAEWERAAATEDAQASHRRYPWGAEPPTAQRANLAGSYLVPIGECAAGDSAWGARQMLGNVWEWTATTFAPYPGFSPDPYEDYSQPWFGTHRVLRGGCFATEPRMARCALRNFYMPERADVFAGFRTCAL